MRQNNRSQLQQLRVRRYVSCRFCRVSLRQSARLMALSLLLLMTCGCAVQQTYEADVAKLPIITSKQKTTFAAWLHMNGRQRPATAQDCDCDEDIVNMKAHGSWGIPVPNYEPYLVASDLNHDGQQDFAAVVTSDDKDKDSGATLLIFNGPFSNQPRSPAYVAQIGSLSHRALFLSMEKHELLIGPFESEGCAFEPSGKTYREDCENTAVPLFR